MSSSKDLYNKRAANLTGSKAISSSTSLSFTSTLSSLLSAPSSASTRGRPRPSKAPKSDIFTTHNKNTKKRALKDVQNSDDEYDGRQTHKQDIGGVDDAVLHRSKKRLEEKSKQYRRMKRGELAELEDGDALIDFDQKWHAEHDSDSDSGTEDDDGEEVEFEDEYGRLRKGSKSEAARMERQKAAKLRHGEDLINMSARPAAPDKIIYGDTIQTHAFVPSNEMEELAAKRDKSVTPPPDTHYEASKEIRTKGVGFYAFSKDEARRAEEMKGLERERQDTERIRREGEGRKEKRKRDIEERKRVVNELRAKKRAENFLGKLGEEMGEKDSEG